MTEKLMPQRKLDRLADRFMRRFILQTTGLTFGDYRHQPDYYDRMAMQYWALEIRRLTGAGFEAYRRESGRYERLAQQQNYNPLIENRPLAAV